MAIRVFINGFGRIGRSVARIVLQDARFELVGINDIFDRSLYPSLFKYDSLYGPLAYEIEQEGERLRIGAHTIHLFCSPDPASLPIDTLEIDLLFQCSGRFLTIESNRPYLRHGVRRVLLSTPPADEMPIYLRGFNHHRYRGEPILSNASCSANAIVPLAAWFEHRFGIDLLSVTMVHSYTAEQPLLDSARAVEELRRIRSATQNILPFTSSATAMTERMLPALRGRCHTQSIRVPTKAATLYDFTMMLHSPTDTEEVRTFLQTLYEGGLNGIMQIDTTHKVSSDYIGDPHSITIDLPRCTVLQERFVKLQAWQDNEYGYAAQMVEMAATINSL